MNPALEDLVEDAAIRETSEEIGLQVTLTNWSVSTLEALEVQAFRPTTIPWDELAFWSDGRALRDYLGPAAGSVSATPS